jgi:hypothetical protein
MGMARAAIHAQPTDGDWRKRLREHIALWLADPSEGLRRTIWSIAKERDESWPEKLLAGAIFFSGGSIGPEGGSLIEPPRAITGQAGCLGDHRGGPCQRLGT